MSKRLNKQVLAEAFGVTPRTVQRWLQQGCPHQRDEDGALSFDVDEVRRWSTAPAPRPAVAPAAPPPSRPTPPPADALDAAPGPASPSLDHVRLRARTAQDLARARKAELELQQEKGLKELGLDERIASAQTWGDLVQLAREVTRHVASGAITTQRGQALRQLLAETRHAVRQQEREATTRGAHDGRLVLVTEEARQLAVDFDTLVNGWRRRWITDALAHHRAADRVELPEGDLGPGAPQLLARLGLDLHGEPVGERPGYLPAPVVPPPE
jgi:hypothetical protein